MTDHPPQRPRRSRKRRILTVSWLVLNVLVSLGMIFTNWCGTVAPSSWHPAVLVSMTFPVWLVMTALCFVVDLFFWRRTALIPGVAMLLCMSAINTFCPLNFPKGRLSESDSLRSFTLMSYNVYLFHDLEDTSATSNPQLDYVLSHRPDIVCIQEAWKFRSTANNKVQPWQLDSLDAVYPFVLIADDDVVLMSKYPADEIDLDYPAGKYRNGTIHGFRIDVGGKQLTVFGVHLRSMFFTKEEKALYREATNIDSVNRNNLSVLRYEMLPKLVVAALDREEQVHLLAGYIERYGGENVIVCGDFNDTENSYPVRYLRDQCGMRDVYTRCGFGPMITYNANRFYFRIDHILYKGALSPHSISRGDIKASDHFPVESVFVWDEMTN